MWFRKGQEKTFLVIAGGFAEILPDRVTLLATVAEKAEDIDVTRAESAKQRAEGRLTQPRSDIDYERARLSLQKAVARLDVASRVPGGMRVGELKRMRETRA
jgi:F-type H+-transporting ATPase subunit epsilon